MTSESQNNYHGLPRCTDVGNAVLFANLFRDRLRFDHGRMRWLLWAKHWWTTDFDGELMRMAKLAARFRLQNSTKIIDADTQKKERQWALQSESLSRLDAMVTLARSERPLADDGGHWDNDPLTFGVANGVVDLRTGEVRPGKPDDRITLHTDVPFDPLAQCPRWNGFIEEIFDGDAELISYIQRAVGYTLTGDISEQCFFCCHGEGGNGKSTFLSAIRFILGDYACNLPFSAFELKARAAIPNDIATIPGRRFITAIETDESAHLNEGRIKALTGGDPVTARLLHREFFTFKPSSKFWLAFNHRPQVADDSHGFWRRVHVIPFTREFDPTGEPDLEEVLRAEAPGILAWALRGCLDWQATGLNPPSTVKAATQNYRDASDPIRDFLADRCIVDPNAHVTAAILWQEFLDWAMQNGDQTALQRAAFTRRLEALGCTKVRRGHDREWTWMGICRRSDPDTDKVADMRADADVKLQ